MPIVTLLAFVLPLGLDSFAVAAAIGATGGLPEGVRWRISVLFLVFEAGMPLIEPRTLFVTDTDSNVFHSVALAARDAAVAGKPGRYPDSVGGPVRPACHVTVRMGRLGTDGAGESA
jgi:hypothetical protein